MADLTDAESTAIATALTCRGDVYAVVTDLLVAARADERERCAQDVDGPGYGTAAIRLRFLARKGADHG